MGHMVDLAIDYCQLLHSSLDSAYKLINPGIAEVFFTEIIVCSHSKFKNRLKY